MVNEKKLIKNISESIREYLLKIKIVLNIFISIHNIGKAAN